MAEKEPLKLVPIEQLKKAVGRIIKADKAAVDEAVPRPQPKPKGPSKDA